MDNRRCRYAVGIASYRAEIVPIPLNPRFFFNEANPRFQKSAEGVAPLALPKRFNRDDWLNLILEGTCLPVETGSLRYVEVGNLHRPSGVRVFARNESGER